MPDDVLRTLQELKTQLDGRQQDLQARMTRRPTPEEWLDALAGMGRDHRLERSLASRLARSLGLPGGAQQRILAYFRQHVGQVIDKDEISGVAGIYEWARRVRELRVEKGWPISSSETRDDLTPGQYILEDEEPDLDLKRRWQIANQIRRTSGSATSRILAYFKANIGRTIAKDELQYVSRIQEHPRRVRELVEAGWQIASNLDRTDLRSGEYIMTSEEQLPARAREHIKLRYEILGRDGFRCKTCGAKPDAGRHLQVHHIQPLHKGGSDEPNNLETLCDACHAGKHAMAKPDVRDELLHPEQERNLAVDQSSTR